MQLMISCLFSHISHIFHDDHYTSCGLLGDCDHATLQKCGHQASSVVTSIHFRISITGSVHWLQPQVLKYSGEAENSSETWNHHDMVGDGHRGNKVAELTYFNTRWARQLWAVPAPNPQEIPRHWRQQHRSRNSMSWQSPAPWTPKQHEISNHRV